MNKFSQTYWENCYINNQIGWDIGYVSPPIKLYFDQISNKNIKILIPGAGNGYEAEYLYNKGFKNITILDIAKQPLENIQNKMPNFPCEYLFQDDFFNHSGSYDYIVEQTFFCSLHPDQRLDYAQKMFDLLNYNGKVIGLLFDFPLTEKGPPYGGSKNEYFEMFSKLFNIHTLKTSYNSIKPRMERELFIIFEKKNLG
ncbi:MAG: SAM-dependent methyltransferase [Bacteroidota bacterium]